MTAGPDAIFGGDMWEDNNYLSVFVMPPRGSSGEAWTLLLGAPAGQPLRTGVYRNAKRVAGFGSGDPRLAFTTSRSCNLSNGEFTVLEATYGPKPANSGTSGTIQRFHATFSQKCDEASAGLTGEVFLLSVPRGCSVTGNC